MKKIIYEKKLTSDCKPLTTSNWKKIQNMLLTDVKVFHSRNSLNDSCPWNLSLNLFQTKCLLLPDNASQTKCYINSQNSIQIKCLTQSNYFSLPWLRIKRNFNLTKKFWKLLVNILMQYAGKASGRIICSGCSFLVHKKWSDIVTHGQLMDDLVLKSNLLMTSLM